MTIRTICSLSLIVIASVVAGGCGAEPPPAQGREVRPVTVMELQPTTPTVGLELMGSADAWKQENVAFEVAGRIEWVVFEAAEVEGPTFDDNGAEVPDTGTVIAKIDQTRYRIALDAANAEADQARKNRVAAEASMRAAAARLSATVAKRDAASAAVRASEANLGIVQSRVASADATLSQAKSARDTAKLLREQAQREYDRQKQLASQNATTEKAVQDAQTQLETSGARLKEAEAAIEAATASRRGALSQVEAARAEVEAARADKAGVEAEIKAVEADITAMGANLELIDAQIRQLEQKVKSAQLDLDRCLLRAPFTGRITMVHTERGALVQPGTPIATLTVMDPMKVELAVSADTDRQLAWRDSVKLVPPGETPDRAVDGMIYMESSTADPATRTFRIEVIVRNRQVPVDERVPEEMLQLPVAQNVWRVFSSVPFQETYGPDVQRSGVDPIARQTDSGARNDAPSARPAVPIIYAPCVHPKAGDATGHYVWRVVNVAPDGTVVGPVIEVERVKVHLLRDEAGALRKKVIGGQMIFYALDPTKEQKIDTCDHLLALTPRLGVWNAETGTIEHVDQAKAPDTGAKALLMRTRWLFRPGDLVAVHLDRGSPGEGLYVPLNCIVRTGGTDYVYVAVSDGAESIAKRVPVTITANVRDLRRIEGDGITAGAKVIVDGAHFLVPDQPIRVVEPENGDPRRSGDSAEVNQ